MAPSRVWRRDPSTRPDPPAEGPDEETPLHSPRPPPRGPMKGPPCRVGWQECPATSPRPLPTYVHMGRALGAQGVRRALSPTPYENKPDVRLFGMVVGWPCTAPHRRVPHRQKRHGEGEGWKHSLWLSHLRTPWRGAGGSQSGQGSQWGPQGRTGRLNPAL